LGVAGIGPLAAGREVVEIAVGVAGDEGGGVGGGRLPVGGNPSAGARHGKGAAVHRVRVVRHGQAGPTRRGRVSRDGRRFCRRDGRG